MFWRKQKLSVCNEWAVNSFKGWNLQFVSRRFCWFVDSLFSLLIYLPQFYRLGVRCQYFLILVLCIQPTNIRDSLINFLTFKRIELLTVCLKLSIVIVNVLFFLSLLVSLKHDNPTSLITQCKKISSWVKLHYVDDILLLDLLVWSLVSKHLLHFVVGSFAHLFLPFFYIIQIKYSISVSYNQKQDYQPLFIETPHLHLAIYSVCSWQQILSFLKDN